MAAGFDEIFPGSLAQRVAAELSQISEAARQNNQSIIDGILKIAEKMGDLDETVKAALTDSIASLVGNQFVHATRIRRKLLLATRTQRTDNLDLSFGLQVDVVDIGFTFGRREDVTTSGESQLEIDMVLGNGRDIDISKIITEAQDESVQALLKTLLEIVKGVPPQAG